MICFPVYDFSWILYTGFKGSRPINEQRLRNDAGEITSILRRRASANFLAFLFYPFLHVQRTASEVLDFTLLRGGIMRDMFCSFLPVWKSFILIFLSFPTTNDERDDSYD